MQFGCDVRPVLLALMQLRGVGQRRAIGLVRDRSDDDRLGLWKNADSVSAESVFRNIVYEHGLNLTEAQLSYTWREATEILQHCTDLGINVISEYNENYPQRLKDLHDPAPLLYVCGNIDALNSPRAVTVVGTRKPCSDGKRISYETSQAAVAADAVVISGLALGCDTAAHIGCLDADGVTVAVMAQGLDRVYPNENRSLSERIVDCGGALVAEHWPRSDVGSWAFATRDRIQSGLSDCLFVAETKKDGGTMNTARYGRKQRRSLACFCPHSGFEDKRFSGNRMMVNNMGAIPFKDAKSFGTYLKTEIFP